MPPPQPIALVINNTVQQQQHQTVTTSAQSSLQPLLFTTQAASSNLLPSISSFSGQQNVYFTRSPVTEIRSQQLIATDEATEAISTDDLSLNIENANAINSPDDDDDDIISGEQLYFLDTENNTYKIVNQSASGYTTSSRGILQISDAAIQQTINPSSSIPTTDPTAASNQRQICELAFKISKMETLLLKLVDTTDKIWNAMQGGSVSRNIVSNPSEASTSANSIRVDDDKFKKINTVEQLTEFEDKLKCTQFKDRTVRFCHSYRILFDYLILNSHLVFTVRCVGAYLQCF